MQTWLRLMNVLPYIFQIVEQGNKATETFVQTGKFNDFRVILSVSMVG